VKRRPARRPARRSARGTEREAPRPRAERGPARPREGRVVAIGRTTARGQRVEVEDEAGERWQVDCLGEPVGEGARVRFEPVEVGSPPRGVLVRVVAEARERWVCTLRRVGRDLALVPFGGVEMPALSLSARAASRLREGDRVVVVREGDAPARGRKRDARGRGGPPRRARERSVAVKIAAVLGPAGDPDADHGALAWKYGLPASFSRRARLEADALPDALTNDALAGRLDLRHLPFVTIDPATARDHDDALFAEPASRGTPEAGVGERLWVAIADVAHFVAEGGFVDAEARRRGNSFYFPDRAIPMLPERLSSDLCSLRPGEDRLVVAVELRLSAEGEILDARFHEAVIRSHAKLSYEEAADLLASTSGADPVGAAGAGDVGWRASLARLAEIAARLGARRRRTGAIELELPEVEIALDQDGRPYDARLRARNPAHGLVEEAMLAANQAVARALDGARRGALHRVHPPPDPRRLEELEGLLERLGFDTAGSLDEPGAIAAMLEAVRGQPAEERVHLATLRSLSQARYEARSRGHFALQFSHYLHFTSPIRRYADLAVHRSLKQLLRHGPSDASEEQSSGLERLAIWLSGRERVASEAEREAAAFACCALLAGREGETFEAEVTGVTEHGLFVRLDRPAANGLVPLRTLDERWRLDPESEGLVEAGGGSRIGVGTRVRVRLERVDSDRGRIGFALVRGARPGARDRDEAVGAGQTVAPGQPSARPSDRDSHSR